MFEQLKRLLGGEVTAEALRAKATGDDSFPIKKVGIVEPYKVLVLWDHPTLNYPVMIDIEGALENDLKPLKNLEKFREIGVMDGGAGIVWEYESLSLPRQELWRRFMRDFRHPL